MSQNYELACSFGPYPPKEVVPEHVFVGHGLDALIEKGLVVPTAKPVTVALVAPQAPSEKPADDLLAERNRVVEENKILRQQLATALGTAKELEKQRDALNAQCGSYAVTEAHLKAACEDHQKQNDVLAAENAKLHKDMEELLAAPAAKK